MSATQDQSAFLHSLELGASDYILKPIKRNYLLEKVAGLVFKDINNAHINPPTVPTQVNLEFDVTLLSFDEVGVFFYSKTFFFKGSMLKLKSSTMPIDSISVRVTKVDRISEEIGYATYGEYINLKEDEIKKLLAP